MKFTKMQGIGNDYVYVNCFLENIQNPSALAVKISDRHFGVGSDGLVMILPSEIADFRMRMLNSDGSESEMCGNAIRCVGKYVYDNGLTTSDVITIETLAGIKTLQLFMLNGKVESVRVDMGEPIIKPRQIPIDADGESFISQALTVADKTYNVTGVSMGNPHAVVYMDEIDHLAIELLGSKFEHHPIFPRRTNTEFVQVIDRQTLKMRVWERGAGETEIWKKADEEIAQAKIDLPEVV
ncbi:MAG: diaminopimelate epimerase, partial [Hyphomonadaceae bacterium]|nr:diaminopimelate epimerase [Clostridia bacterium]